MGTVTYSMNTSLDGYIAGPDGSFDWTHPDEELHRHFNQRSREAVASVYGRRLYETMLYWETADRDSSLSEWEREFGEVWRATPKYVASRTLESVEGTKTSLIEGELATEVRRLKDEVDGMIEVGGAALAASLIEHDLIDEYEPVVHPVIVGGGTSFLPTLDREQLDLELVETRRFRSGAVLLRHRRTGKRR
jgi:dihydrofolate reductase